MINATLQETGESPAYLNNTDIKAMFNWLLDHLDRQPLEQRVRPISSPVDKKTLLFFRTLHDPTKFEDAEVLWQMLQRCEKDGLIRIRSDRKRRDPTKPPWSCKRIVFALDPEGEADLRRWLNRPKVSPEEKAWQRALFNNAQMFKRTDLLTYADFRTLGKPAEDIVSRLAAIAYAVAARPLTARQLSARLFWGNSKVLDGKEQKLCASLGLPQNAILERVLAVEISFPAKPPGGILMLENLDSYFCACNGNWPDCDDLIIVYTQGFRGAAARIRNPAFARLHISDRHLPESARYIAFRDEWYQGGGFSHPVHFCGDMDWAGLSIFRSLKSVFPDLKPWKSGYEQMLSAAEQGNWHSLEMAGKSGQIPLETCNDPWLDTHILAYLKANNRFVDQEVIG